MVTAVKSVDEDQVPSFFSDLNAYAAKPQQGPKRNYGKTLRGLAGVVTLLTIWELVARFGAVEQRYFPPATEVLAALADKAATGAYWKAIGETLTAWSIGLVIAVVVATVAGFVIGRTPFLLKLTHSVVEFIRPIPSVALIPLVVLVSGVKLESELVLIVYACFWPFFIQLLYGVNDVDNVALQTARSYGFGAFDRLRHVILPSALPYVMTGLRLAATVALILSITAELVIGTNGIGHEIAQTRSGGMVTSMYTWVITSGLIGVLINLGMRWIERRVLPWHQSIRSETAS